MIMLEHETATKENIKIYLLWLMIKIHLVWEI